MVILLVTMLSSSDNVVDPARHATEACQYIKYLLNDIHVKQANVVDMVNHIGNQVMPIIINFALYKSTVHSYTKY